jgi:hypothetical protein
MRIVYFILVIALLSGCGRTPSNLAHQIARSDRMVIRYRFADRQPELSTFRLTISGDKVSEIVRAVSSAKRVPYTLSAWDLELQFYSDTNCLAIVDFQGDVFIVERDEYQYEYRDRSGVLAELDQKFRILSRAHSNPVPPNKSLEPTATAPSASSKP